MTTRHHPTMAKDRARFIALSASATRHAIKDADGQQYRRERADFLRQWRENPGAIREQFTWRCSCGLDVAPCVFDGPDGPLVRWRDRCTCGQERAGVPPSPVLSETEKKALAHERYTRALVAAGLIGLRDKTFGSFDGRRDGQDWTAQKQAAWQYTSALLGGSLVHPFLLLYGDYGTGKTHLAAAIIHQCIKQGWSGCYFRPWGEWLDRLRDSYGDRTIKSAEITGELATGRVVVLDDIDKQGESATGFAESRLFLAINHRYNENLPTVITLNHRLADRYILPILGPAGIDRIIGATGGTDYTGQRIGFEGRSARSGVKW